MPFTKEYLLSIPCRKPIIDRLMSKIEIDDNGCWCYTGSLDRCGYGKINIDRRNLGAHKVMYLLARGNFDQEKYEMLHLCHNRKCINPGHLKHGTHYENLTPIINSGRLFGDKVGGDGGKRIKDKSVLLGSGGCGYRVCAENTLICLLFEKTSELDHNGFDSGRVSQAVYHNRMYKGYRWKYIKTIND